MSFFQGMIVDFRLNLYDLTNLKLNLKMCLIV